MSHRNIISFFRNYRLVTVLIFLLQSVVLMSQTQRGIVRTALRPNKKIVYLPGVTIRQRGSHTAVLSGAGGKFEMTMSKAKAGDAFYLSSVRKSGYELADNRTIGRAFTYSSKVPIEIVMINTREKEEDIRRISDNSYRRAEKTYKQRISQLEKQLQEKTISEASYREQLQKIQTSFEKNESLINSMAERYASTDYATIDSLNAVVNIAIENGDLERADSLISTVGSLEERTMQLNVAEGNAIANLAKIKEAKNRHADLLYSKYSICLIRAENDSAAYYIQMRAELDTTNVEWQLEAGLFIADYLADYEEAMALYKRALHSAIEQFGDSHPYLATCYNNIGGVYDSQGNYYQALEYFNKALEILLSVFGDRHPYVATSYNNIGAVYSSQGNYDQALEYHNKALEIYLSVYGDGHPNVAGSYNNIGSVYDSQGNYSKALEYYNKALKIRLLVFGERHPYVATSYNNIGVVYYKQGNYVQALEYYNKALEIRLSVFGEIHPDMATSYNNIGVVYCIQRNYARALEYYNKALKIFISVFGERHTKVATNYYNIGAVYYSQENYTQALEYENKALKIFLSVFGEKHSEIATCYNNIGAVYCSQENYTQALRYYNKALEIYLLIFGDKHPDVATSYNNIGSVYSRQGNYDLALEYYNKALKILLSIFGERHPKVFTCYCNIGITYYMQGLYSKAKTNLLKAFKIRKTLLNTDDVNMQTLLSMLYHSLIKTLSSDTDEYLSFISDKIFIATVVPYDFTASQQSMSGEYYLLEYSDWNFENTTDLFDKNDELKDKPKDIVVMKDGVITKHHLEDTIGIQLGLKFVSKEEKQRITEAYHKWKEEQGNDD